MDFGDASSFLDGTGDKGIEREAAGKASVPEVEKDWKTEVRPAIEESFEDDMEYVFHPARISYETGLTSDYVETCMEYYSTELEQEDFVLEERVKGYWSLHRF